MENRIRLLATSDVHGFIYPYKYSDNSAAPMGLARIKTLADSLRDENTLLIDNGDILEGSPLSFFHFLKYPNEVTPMSKVMKAMGYDYINLGNHDFNYGREAMERHLEAVGAPCITTNVLHNGKAYAEPYTIREIAGKKLALIGLTTQYIPNWEMADHIVNMDFLDALETLKKNVALAKEANPDYIIAVYHGGFEKDLEAGFDTEDQTGENLGWRMLEEVEGLDILISGHQHRSLAGTKNGIAYTQTNCNAQELACIDINLETGEITPSVLKADVPADEAICALVKEEEDECQIWLDQALGQAETDLKVIDENDGRLHKSQLITFLNHVQMDVTGAEISSTALFLGATGFDHDITMRNLVSTYVYPNTLVIKKITGKILKEYLEQDAKFWILDEEGKIKVNPEYDWPKPQHFNYDMLDGCEYTIDVSRPFGERITALTRNGKDILPEDEFTICLNNYRASGGGNYSMLKEAPTVSENLSSMVELLAEWILEHKVISFEPVNNIQVIA